MRQAIWILVGLIGLVYSAGPTLAVLNTDILQTKDKYVVMSQGQLSDYYNDDTFNEVFTCRNGGLQIINSTASPYMSLSYSGVPMSNQSIIVTVGPNKSPKPNAYMVNSTSLMIDFRCPANPDNGDYYNKVTVSLPQGYEFSFLLNCDPQGRHKKFEFGYLVISLINLAVIVGVAMYSHIWSIRVKGSLLQLQLRWQPFLIFSIGMLVIIGVFYIFAYNELLTAFIVARYIGIFVAIFFVFICLNQVLFLSKMLREPIYKKLQRCQTISGVVTIAITILACFIQNWIFYNLLAICICVGAIKLFKFRSLKQAFLSKTILVVTVTSITIASHWVLEQSYNDYAGQLASPLFIQVPDLIDNLYKKCSWLPVFDVILPGLLLSYLRIHDYNKGSKWFGVYTVVGNVTFIIGTVVWIVIEAFYDFSVPFSLITYLSLMLIIFIVSWSRNEWDILFTGAFQQERQYFNPDNLEERERRFSSLVERDALSPLMRSSSTNSLVKSGPGAQP